jgi:glutathione synthase/RimK-type ligase-like ATP-grasp enzyme
VPELPLVLKPRFGSWGRDVERCSTAEELDAALVRLQQKRWFREHGALAQELVEPRGSRLEAPAAEPPLPGRKTDAAVDGRIWDLRLVVAGGQVVGAVCRIARGDEWRTNAALGAQVEAVEPPPIARALALAAAQAAHADLVGVDLLPTPNGGFLVLELNGAVDFRPLYAPNRDVYTDVVAALLEDRVRQAEPAAASV